MDKFAEHTHSGLHLEKLQHPKDDRIRTIRIDIHWRGVVLAPDSGDTYYLLKVMEHDKAYAYAGSRKFTVNQACLLYTVVARWFSVSFAGSTTRVRPPSSATTSGGLLWQL